MSGMLPGVECARRRRLQQSGVPHNSMRRSFSLYSPNSFESTPFSSSLPQRSMLNEAYPDEELEGAAREAKQRLDEKFRAIRSLENQRCDQKRKGLFQGLCRLQLRS